MQKKIAIIGNGKLAKALILGFLRSGITAENITVVHRVKTKSDLSFFKKKDIETTSDMQKIVEATHIILAVTPQGAGNVIMRLEKVDFLTTVGHRRHEIISFVSGLSTSDILTRVRHGSYNTICATLNTNVAYGKGIICASLPSDLFKYLGTYIQETPERILRSIETVGSGAAFDGLALILGYEPYANKIPLRTWLKGLQTALGNFDFTKKYHNEYSVVCSYLKVKSSILRNSQFRYTYKSANQRSLITMKSTVESLLSMEDELTIDTIRGIIKTVVTEGGSTEKGINAITTVEQLLSREYLEKEVFIPVWNRTLKFRNDVLDSIVEEKKQLAA
jgi:hypothetical protein